MTLLDFVRAFFALIVVLSLIGIGAFAAQRFGIGPARAAAPRRKRRLALMDVLPLDQKRKAAILRCDGVDHLIILNASGVTVVERAINRRAEKAHGDHQDTHQPAAPAGTTDADVRRTHENGPRPLGDNRNTTSAIADGPAYLALPEPAAGTAAGTATETQTTHASRPNGVSALMARIRAAAPEIAARFRKRRRTDEPEQANAKDAA